MKMYRASHHTFSIKEIEADSETDKFVTIGKYRQAKLSRYDSFHDSREKAKNKLLDILNTEICQLENQLTRKKEQFKKVIDL